MADARHDLLLLRLPRQVGVDVERPGPELDGGGRGVRRSAVREVDATPYAARTLHRHKSASERVFARLPT
jgi:hypothetical protein